MKKELISVVIPVCNEETSLPLMLSRLDSISSDTGHPFEIIVVDDGSQDRTWESLKSIHLTSGNLKGIRLTRNFGKEAAIFAGLRAAQGEAAIVMDADFQHPPDLIPAMIDLWRGKKIPIVEAEKEERQAESTLRRFAANLFYYSMRTNTGLDLRMSTDFKLLDRSVVLQYVNLPERRRFFRGLTKWMGFTSATVKFIPPDRHDSRSESRWNIGSLFRFARNSFMAFTAMPMRVVTWLGCITLVFSILLGISTLWQKFSGQAVEGFATVILVQLGIGSILMISLGLIGEYLACVYEEVKGRPVCTIAEMIEVNRNTEIQSVLSRMDEKGKI